MAVVDQMTRAWATTRNHQQIIISNGKNSQQLQKGHPSLKFNRMTRIIAEFQANSFDNNSS